MATRKWGPERLVNTNLPGTQWFSSVAGLTGGGFVVVWGDQSGADPVIRGQRYDALGNRLGGEIDISGPTFNVDAQTLPSVTGLADGGFYVSWQDFDSASDNDIVGAVFNASGVFVRTQDGAGDVSNSTNSAAARLGAGSVVAFEHPDSDQDGIFFRVFDALGGGGGTPLPANTTTAGSQANPSVAAAPSGGRFAVVWHSNDDFTVRGRLFTSTGAQAAPEFLIAASTTFIDDAVVTWLNNGTFAVAWRENNPSLSDNQIRVKIYDGAGGTAIALTGNILVNSTFFESQQSPTIVALPNGGFVVAWEDWSGVGGDPGTAIRLQVFDGSGGKIGGEMLVNTSTSNLQRFPTISALADGRVVVSWTDNSSGGGNDDIRMQIVDPRDGVVTGTPGNDTLYGHDSVADEISGFAGNDIFNGLGGADQLYGGEGNDLLSGGRGDDTLFGDSGADTLRGELGDDEMFGGDGADNLLGSPGADLIDGGASGDAVTYAAATARVTAALDGSLAGTGDAAGDVFVSVETIYGSNLAASGDTLRGDAGANTVVGLAGNDNLNGRAGADRLIGGLGADTLTGEAGNDDYWYNAQNEGGDSLTSFSSFAAGNDDRFRFLGSAFGGLPVGPLVASQFQSSTANTAANPNVRFFYETDARILRFDQDGSATAFAPVVIATLQAGATMTISDILMF